MWLRSIITEVLKEEEYKIIDEREFRTLALADIEVGKEKCTFLDNEKLIGLISKDTSMLITTECTAKKMKTREFGLLIVKEPREVFFELHNYLSMNEKNYYRQKFATRVGNKSKISPLASIAPNNVIIGNNVQIEEFVVIRENTVIEDNCVIRAGVKVGGEGFEFKRKGKTIFSVKHAGGVIIEAEVEIQYNSCVDKAVYPWDNTIIGKYSKIDNLVHVGHGVKMGQSIMVVAQSGIGGRTVIQDNVWIGFGATLRNGISIGKDARVNMGAVVTKSIDDNEAVSGNFAMEHSKFIRKLKENN